MLPFTETENTRVAAVVGTMLSAQDIGMNSPAHDIVIETTTECGQLGACYNTGGHVTLGKNTPSDPVPTNRFKNIIGHETGHNIMYAMAGYIYIDYNANNAQPGVSSPYCRCDHIDLGNNTHCLQSKEAIEGFAINEGLGHFQAANAFNPRMAGSCKFTYYKKFKEFDGGTPSPVAKSCLNTKWMETTCTESGNVGFGNEWDWMDFFRDTHTVNTSARINMYDLFQSSRRLVPDRPQPGVLARA